MDPELDLPFLQALLCCRKVIHISIADVVCFTERAVLAACNDSLRNIIDLRDAFADHDRIKDVIVVPPAVESDQLVLYQFLNFMGPGVDHPLALLITRILPVHQHQIREHLNIKEHDLVVRLIGHRFGMFFAFELHPRHPCQAIFRLMAGVDCKVHNVRPHVRHVVLQSAFVRVVQYLFDKVNTGFCAGMDLLVQVPFNQIAKPLFTLNGIKVNRFLHLFHRQPAGQMGDWNIIALPHPPPQAAVPPEGLHFNPGLEHACQFGNITVPDVVQVKTLPALAYFGIGRFPS